MPRPAPPRVRADVDAHRAIFSAPPGAGVGGDLSLAGAAAGEDGGGEEHEGSGSAHALVTHGRSPPLPDGRP